MGKKHLQSRYRHTSKKLLTIIGKVQNIMKYKLQPKLKKTVSLEGLKILRGTIQLRPIYIVALINYLFYIKAGEGGGGEFLPAACQNQSIFNG